MGLIFINQIYPCKIFSISSNQKSVLGWLSERSKIRKLDQLVSPEEKLLNLGGF